jgi:hypothetical protein
MSIRILAVVCSLIGLVASGCGSSSSGSDSDGGMVQNGGFNGMAHWDTWQQNGAEATFSTQGGVLTCNISARTALSTNIQLKYVGGLDLVSGHTYRLSFDGWADANRSLDTSIWENGHDLDENGFAWSTYKYSTHALTTSTQHFTVDFTMPFTNSDAGIAFFLDGDSAAVHVDNVALREP